MRQNIKYLIWWIILTGLYLLLAWSTAWAELGIGLLVSAITIWLSVKLQLQQKHHFTPGTGWLILLKRLPAQVIGDTSLVITALQQRLTRPDYHPGALKTLPFHGGGNTAEDAARRALITASLSFSPNSYVVLIKPERDTLLIHQLVPSEQPPGQGDQEWPL